MGEKPSGKESEARAPEYAFSVRELQDKIFTNFHGGSGWFSDSMVFVTEGIPKVREAVGMRSILKAFEGFLEGLPSHPRVDDSLRRAILDFRAAPSRAGEELEAEDFAALAETIKEWLDAHLTYRDVTFLDERSAEHFAEALRKINELVWCRYLFEDKVMELHIASARHLPPMQRLKLFHEGMEGLKAEVRKEIAHGHPVKTVRGVSWIVRASPESVKRFGFHVVQDNEGRPTSTCELTVDEAWLKTGTKR